MKVGELIALCSDALGDGFLVPDGYEGYYQKCPECDVVRSGSRHDNTEHGKDCSIGIAVKALEAYYG